MKSTTKLMVIAAALMVTAVVAVGIIGSADDSYADTEYEAKIGDTSYETLAAAIAAAQNGDTVTLLTNVSISAPIEVDVVMTIDLGENTITYSGASSTAAIYNRGTLTLTGAGAITSTVTAATLINFPDATCTINGGTYTSSGWYVIRNYGTMNITGGAVNGTNGNVASLITNGWYGSSDPQVGAATADKASLTITDGSFNGHAGDKSCSIVKNDDYGIAVINGGTFDSTANNSAEDAAIILNWNDMTINGGTFSGSYISNGNCNDTSDKGVLVINGGTFNTSHGPFGTNGGAVDGKGTLTVTGGTFNDSSTGSWGTKYSVSISGGMFSIEPPSEKIADGKTAFFDPTENMYVVVNVYTVSVDTGIQNGTVVADKTSATAGETITLTITPDTGYQLKSVSYTAEGSTAPVAITGTTFSMPAANVTVTAVFEKQTFPVTIVGDGVTVYNVTVIVNDGDMVEYGSNLTTSIAAKTGYNGAVTPETANVTGPVTFTVSYVAITYTIAFDANGGEGSMSPIAGVKYDIGMGLTPNTFTKADFAFGGWATTATGTAVYSDKGTVLNLTSVDGETVTLYAVWLAVEKKDNTAEIDVTTNMVSDSAAQAVVDAAKGMGEGSTAMINATATDDMTVNATYVKDAADNNVNVTLGTKSGSLELSAEALKNLNLADGAALTTEIMRVDTPSGYDLGQNAVVFSVMLSADGTPYTTQFGTDFVIKVAYTPAAGFDLSKLKVQYLKDDGTLEDVQGTYADGYVTITTNHLSQYAISFAGDSDEGPNGGTVAFIVVFAALVVMIVAVVALARKL